MLTDKEILARAPAAGATKAASHCSPEYIIIPTMEMVAALRKDGFVPVEARQDKARIDPVWRRHEHVRHMIKFRLVGTERVSKKAMAATGVPEITMLNSTDGSCLFDLLLGIYRKVCSNGLIAMVAKDAVRNVHRRVTADEVIERARRLSANSKPLFDKIQRWSKIRLNDTAQLRYAQEALSIRAPESRAHLYDPKSALEIRRPEDAEPTLWNIFNRVQEASMKGFIRSPEPSDNGAPPRRLALRPITGIAAEVELNTQLWELTERWAEKVK